MATTRFSARSVTLGLLLLSAATAVFSLGFGPSDVGSLDALQAAAHHLLGIGDPPDETTDAILWRLRAPRIAVAGLVGACLALAGTLLQGLFRNVLAAPGVIGTTAGASFGAVLALSLGWATWSLWALPTSAMLGALGSLAVVTAVARSQGRTPVTTLLLAGVALTAFLSAVNGWMLARSYSDFELARRIAYWILGGVADRGWQHAGLVAPALVIGLIAASRLAVDLDLMLQGEETAETLGVPVERSKRLVLVVAAILVGAAVSVAGVVGFVGLVVPHILRMLVGPAHRPLVWASALGGAWFLIAADLFARSAAASELQLGIVTSFVGAPFFLYLLTRQRVQELS